jgi:mRNA interferase MazF
MRAWLGWRVSVINGPMSWATSGRTSTPSRTERLLIHADEIYLASFPFGDTAGTKLRPVLTLTEPVGPVPEVLVAYISSVIPNVLLSSDIILDPTMAEHKSTKLKMRSALRLHKLATIHTSAMVRRLGNLSSTTISDVDQKLRMLLGI